MIVYESTDGLLMRNATGSFSCGIERLRIAAHSRQSLIAVGLLNGVSAQDLADPRSLSATH